MLGISYGELFLLLGATAALIGPKDLPIIARTAGRLAGRAIGYVQIARGQFENVMQHTQVHQVHKDFQDNMAQFRAIGHEAIRSFSVMNPGPMTRRVMDDIEHTPSDNGNNVIEKHAGEQKARDTISKDPGATTLSPASLQGQAMTYARLAESQALKTASPMNSGAVEKLSDDAYLFTVLPVSAEDTGMRPKCSDDVKGSDIVLEAIVEAEVAHKAKIFFAQPENQIQCE